jgi:Ca2+-binding EF-hand superfamily protein
MRLAALELLVCSLAVLPLAAAQEGRFAAADADRDGLLSRAEVQRSLPRTAPRFDEIDRNRDGSLSPAELRAWSGGGRTRGRSGEGGFAEHFRRADADGDGALTRDETARALPRLSAKFERIDADRDGRLTPEELRRYFDARRAARGRPGAESPGASRHPLSQGGS